MFNLIRRIMMALTFTTEDQDADRKKKATFHVTPAPASPRTALPPAVPHTSDGRAREATSPAAAAHHASGKRRAASSARRRQGLRAGGGCWTAGALKRLLQMLKKEAERSMRAARRSTPGRGTPATPPPRGSVPRGRRPDARRVLPRPRGPRGAGSETAPQRRYGSGEWVAAETYVDSMQPGGSWC